MRSASVLLAAGALAAFNTPTPTAPVKPTPAPTAPTEQVIDALEQKLAADQCVGKLDQWERHYAFAPGEPGIIAYQLLEAGTQGWKAGRHIHATPLPDEIPTPDGAYGLVLGNYDPLTGKVEMWACATVE